MLLSIDRVLQLLAEGKSMEKIAELASCLPENVADVINEARILLSKYEKPASRRKIIIHKKAPDSTEDRNPALFFGAELSAVPLNSKLTFYVAGETLPTKQAAIGIVVTDSEDRQVGKLASYIGKVSAARAVCTAIKRALEIAGCFSPSELSVKISNENLCKHLNGEITIERAGLSDQREEIMGQMKKFPGAKLEYISRDRNEKAVYFALKSLEKYKE